MCMSGGRLWANFAPGEPIFFLIDRESKSNSWTGGVEMESEHGIRVKIAKNCLKRPFCRATRMHVTGHYQYHLEATACRPICQVEQR